MEIKSAEFIKGIIGSDKILEDNKMQIAFIGRSNVGKSSVINSLVNRKDLVRSGSMPGRTKQLDFFLINNEFYFVDLPGYGYAKISEDQRIKLKKLMLWYLFENTHLNRKIILIIDAEVGPKKTDFEILHMIEEYKLDLIILANKADKIKKSMIEKNYMNLQQLFPTHKVILYSSKTKLGKELLLNELF